MDVEGSTRSSSVLVREPSKDSVYSHAREVFGDPRKVYSWMTAPNPFFRGLCPKDFIECGSVEDLAIVMEELNRIDQGLF